MSGDSAVTADRRRAWGIPVSYGPMPDAEELDTCPVCQHAVLSDWNGTRHPHGSKSSPILMDDGRWTHYGCVPDYYRVTAEQAAIHAYRPTLDDILDTGCDLGYLGTSTSEATERWLADRDREHVRPAGIATPPTPWSDR